jgi:hypothetical protein
MPPAVTLASQAVLLLLVNINEAYCEAPVSTDTHDDAHKAKQGGLQSMLAGAPLHRHTLLLHSARLVAPPMPT